MLVLSRKTGQEIVLADTIHVRVLEIRGNRVLLGFTAPGDVKIQRAEIIASECPTRPTDDSRVSVAAAASRSQLLLPSA